MARPVNAFPSRLTFGLAALGLAGCDSLSRLYVQEVKAELSKPLAMDTTRISESALARLPEPVQRYFRFAGWLGRMPPRNARIVWEDFQLKRGHDKPWMPLACRQFNAVPEPARFALMDGRLFKVMPFQGRDKYQAGHGHMLIKALGLVTVVDEKSRKMDESGLVTVLAEALLVPSYALQPYLHWEALDSSRAKATLKWQGMEASGIFHFAPTGEFTRFETPVRWQQGNDSVPIPWSGLMYDYREQDGIRFPRGVSAVWHEKGGDFEYVRGRIARLEFDVSEP